MSVIGWIRDLFGIQKDMYETKKTRLEIEKIEDERREKSIFPASFEDVKRYDPRYRELMEAIRPKDEPEARYDPADSSYYTWKLRRRRRIIFLLLVVLLLMALIIYYSHPR